MRKSVFSPEYLLLRKLLKEARTNAELSQRELAARLDVPHSWVAKVESGERRIDVVEFLWFIQACGRNPVSICSKLANLANAHRRPSK